MEQETPKVFHGIFNNWETIVEEFGIQASDLAGAKILFASYEYRNYEGAAFVLFERGGKLWEVNGSHCSCYGLTQDQWQPEETSVEALQKRVAEKWFSESLLGGEDLGRILKALTPPTPAPADLQVGEVSAPEARTDWSSLAGPSILREAVREALFDATKSTHQAEPAQSAEDLEWLASVPLEFHSIAKRWGQESFTLGFQTWIAGSALEALAAQAQGLLQALAAESARARKLANAAHPQIVQAHTALVQVTNYLVGSARETLGLQHKDLQEIQQDLQRAAALAGAGRGGASASGLVVVKH